MKNKYHIAFRVLLLLFVSSGIFIFSFHYHSDLDWDHATSHCETDAHLSESDIHCPVCGFRLDGAPVEPTSPVAVQHVISVIHHTANSIADELFTAPLNGRSPPTLN